MNPKAFSEWWKFLMIVKTNKAQKYLKVQTIVFISTIAIALLMKIFGVEHTTIRNINTRSILLSIFVLSILFYLAFVLPALKTEKEEKKKAEESMSWVEKIEKYSKPRPY